MKKMALLLVLALALLPVSALADAQKGDRGEEVRYLQWLLQETGWLHERPDGVFGAHTEQAVKDYQAAKGYEETGIADYDLMREMDQDRVRLDKEIHGQDYYQPYTGNFTPPFSTDYNVATHCQTTVLRDMAYRDSCERHLALAQSDLAYAQSGEAAPYGEASSLWLNAIELMYDAWSVEADAAQKTDILATWTAWNAAFAEQLNAMYAVWDDVPVVEQQLTRMTRSYSDALCEIRSGDLPVAPNMAYLEPSDAAADTYCSLWSINVGTEFTTGCAEHAPLFSMEYEWSYAGGSDLDALAALSAAWDDALAALYDRWAALCDPQQAEAVRSAQSMFTDALARQDALLANDENPVLAPLGHVRVVQFEVTRLCELLNFIKLAD